MDELSEFSAERNRKFHFFIFFSLGVIVLFGIGYFFGMPVRFFVWEFDVNLPLFSLLFFFFYWGKKYKWNYSYKNIGFLKISFIPSVCIFCFPLFFVEVTILSGFVLKNIEIPPISNTLTVALGILLDIPANLFFSISLVMAEEIFFRGVIFREIQQRKNNVAGVVVSSFVFAFYSSLIFFTLPEIQTITIASLLLFWFSIGTISATLFSITKSLWAPYLFRVGLTAFSSPCLPRFSASENTLFLSKSPLFFGDGCVVSGAILLSSACLLSLVSFVYGRNSNPISKA